MIKLIALLKRKPDISVDEFNRRWVEEHTKISRNLPGLKGYRINLALPKQPKEDLINGEPIYDGTAELWWESIEEMEAGFASEIGKKAGADADPFADVRIHIYTEEHIIT